MTTLASRVEPHPSWSVTERVNWLFTQLLMAALWLGFFWFGAKIFRDSPIDEVVDSLIWLAQATWLYLAALALWVGFNIVLYQWRGPARPNAQETTVFSQDYFGRRITLAPEATLRDSHLIVEMKEGAKVYGHEEPATPTPAPEPPRGLPILVESDTQGATQDRAFAVGA